MENIGQARAFALAQPKKNKFPSLRERDKGMGRCILINVATALISKNLDM